MSSRCVNVEQILAPVFGDEQNCATSRQKTSEQYDSKVPPVVALLYYIVTSAGASLNDPLAPPPKQQKVSHLNLCQPFFTHHHVTYPQSHNLFSHLQQVNLCEPLYLARVWPILYTDI